MISESKTGKAFGWLPQPKTGNVFLLGCFPVTGKGYFLMSKATQERPSHNLYLGVTCKGPVLPYSWAALAKTVYDQLTKLPLCLRAIPPRLVTSCRYLTHC